MPRFAAISLRLAPVCVACLGSAAPVAGQAPPVLASSFDAGADNVEWTVEQSPLNPDQITVRWTAEIGVDEELVSLSATAPRDEGAAESRRPTSAQSTIAGAIVFQRP